MKIKITREELKKQIEPQVSARGLKFLMDFPDTIELEGEEVEADCCYKNPHCPVCPSKKPQPSDIEELYFAHKVSPDPLDSRWINEHNFKLMLDKINELVRAVDRLNKRHGIL